MKLKGLFIPLCGLFFVLEPGVVHGSQLARLGRLAAAARSATVQAVKQSEVVRKVTAKADVLTHKARSYFEKYPTIKSVLPIPPKKILELGRFTIAQEPSADPLTGETRSFYTMVYCDGKVSEGWKLFSYFFDLEHKGKDAASFMQLSSEDHNKIALAALNSHAVDCHSVYFSSVLPYVTSEADRVFYTEKFIQSGQVKALYPSQIEKIFGLLPWQHRSRLALECLKPMFSSVFSPSLRAIVVLIKQLEAEKDAFFYAKELLSLLSNQRPSDGTPIAIQDVLDIFAVPEQKSRFALYCLQDPRLQSENALSLLEYVLAPSDRAACAEQYIVHSDRSYLSVNSLQKFMNYLPEKRKNFIALDDLEKCFEMLGKAHGHFSLSSLNDRMELMIKALTVESDIFHYLEKRIDAPLVMREDQLLSLLSHLLDGQKNKFILKKLEKSFDNLRIGYLACMIDCLSCADDKARYSTRLLQDGKCRDLSPLQLGRLCGPIAQAVLEKSFDTLNETQVGALIPHLPNSVRAEWFKRLATSEKATFLSVCVPTAPVQGPLFSCYSLTHLSQITGWFTEYWEHRSAFDYAQRKESRTHFFERIMRFTEGEYLKNRIVLFHGQNDQWAFLETLFKRLLFVSRGVETPKKFVWLRFSQEAGLTNQESAEISIHGVSGEDGKKFEKYRFKVLFANLHLLANHWGSNSLLYTLTNSDQSAGRRFDFTGSIENQCAELGMAEEYKQLLAEDPKMFDRLYDLYKSEVLARGDIGRLIVFSLPRPIAQSLCYPTRSGGGVYPLKVNGKLTTDVTEIADHFDQAPASNEYCLILHQYITDPKKAAEAGVVMETFSSASTEESQKYAQEFERELDRTMNRVAQLLHKRRA